MPTDETTLARLAETWEERARRFAASAEDSESSSDIERYRAAPLYRRAAAEARLIADALRFRLAALTAPAAQEGATITEYTLGDMEDRDRSHLLVRVRYRGRGKWAVCRLGDVLNRDGEWEWEPLPSSRDDAFFARCRFDSAADAIAAARKVLAAAVPRGGDDA